MYTHTHTQCFCINSLMHMYKKNICYPRVRSTPHHRTAQRAKYNTMFQSKRVRWSSARPESRISYNTFLNYKNNVCTTGRRRRPCPMRAVRMSRSCAALFCAQSIVLLCVWGDRMHSITISFSCFKSSFMYF